MVAKHKTALKVAVAEDQPEVQKTFVLLLQHLGHDVVCVAANGEELLNQCALGDVDIVFVDLDMPVMDGLATAEHLKKHGIPVILCSSFVEKNYPGHICI